MRYSQTFMKLYLVTQEVPYLSQTFFERFCWLDSGFGQNNFSKLLTDKTLVNLEFIRHILADWRQVLK